MPSQAVLAATSRLVATRCADGGRLHQRDQSGRICSGTASRKCLCRPRACGNSSIDRQLPLVENSECLRVTDIRCSGSRICAVGEQEGCFGHALFGGLASMAPSKQLTTTAELSMRSTLGDWPSHRSAKVAPALSLVPEPDLRVDADGRSQSPPRWNQQPTESGSAAIPGVVSSKHLHERHGVHRIDPQSPGHHRYMIAPGVGAVLAPLPPSAGRSRRDKAAFYPPPANQPATALEDDDAELLFADIWPSPTVTSRMQDHSTNRTAIGQVRASMGRRSCEPRLEQPEDRSARKSGRFRTPPEEQRLGVGRMRGQLAYRSPQQLGSPVMEEPASPTHLRASVSDSRRERSSGRKSARRHWGGGSEILDSTRGRVRRDLSVSSSLSYASPVEAEREQQVTQQQAATISAVDRWLSRTGGPLPQQWEDMGASQLSPPSNPHAHLDAYSPLHDPHRGHSTEVFGVTRRNGDAW